MSNQVTPEDLTTQELELTFPTEKIDFPREWRYSSSYSNDLIKGKKTNTIHTRESLEKQASIAILSNSA